MVIRMRRDDLVVKNGPWNEHAHLFTVKINHSANELCIRCTQSLQKTFNIQMCNAFALKLNKQHYVCTAMCKPMVQTVNVWKGFLTQCSFSVALLVGFVWGKFKNKTKQNKKTYKFFVVKWSKHCTNMKKQIHYRHDLDLHILFHFPIK